MTKNGWWVSRLGARRIRAFNMHAYIQVSFQADKLQMKSRIPVFPHISTMHQLTANTRPKMEFYNPKDNVSQKTRHSTHVDNFGKYWSIFKILSLIDSEQTFLQTKYFIAHRTLQMLLHYLVILQCFKNRINSKIHHRRTLFWSILRMYRLNFFLVKLECQ